MEQKTLPDISTQARGLEEMSSRILMMAGVLLVVGGGGAIGLALGSDGGMHRLAETYLVSFAYFLSLALGALFFVLLQHLTHAGWSVVVRRLAEALSVNVILMAVLVIPVLLNMEHLYHWAHPGAADHDAILAGKTPFLNPQFFTIRLVVYFAIWSLLAWFFFSNSRKQDSTADPKFTRRMEALSAPGMILFALSLNFAAFDLLMSVNPHWFSTIFGVYFFAGSVVVIMATLVILAAYLQRQGRLQGIVTVEHYHDLGKLLFGFVVFWAYIAFSQYMLYWYGNIPEETVWYLTRQTGNWTGISVALLFGHFVIPFLALVSRFPKRRPRLLVLAALWMLAMHWLDLYYLVGPEFHPEGASIGLMDILCFLGMGGLFFLVLAWRLRKIALVPVGDPRLAESLSFENS
ncbi:MAG: quinol:cytochrome C oxidoreductase [Acidobacteria bacterium]|nr:MAG: quinol:cytochrome C oxidoreductase [Acidobacteriota bacterium]